MRARVVRSVAFVALVACTCVCVARGQSSSSSSQPPDERGIKEPRVALADAAMAFDIEGHAAIGARLRTQQIAGSQDAPVRNVVIVVENRSALFYNYASGWATFYDAAGVRCGEGLWKVEAFAPGESSEVDTPGLRLTCTPATWRVTALNLLTRTSDIAKPNEPAPATAQAQPTSATQTSATQMNATSATSATSASAETVPRLEININGKTLPLQLDNPVDIIVGKERVRVVVRRAP